LTYKREVGRRKETGESHANDEATRKEKMGLYFRERYEGGINSGQEGFKKERRVK